MHTVAEVGYWNHPRLVAFSRKVRNPDAGAWILRLREFVLLHGTDDGRLPGYSAEEIEAVMQPTCNARLLFTALDRAGFLKRRKKTWYVPEWAQSPMGKYCKDRAWDRKRKQDLRAARFAADLQAAAAGMETDVSTGRPPDRQRTSSGDLTVSKESRPPDGVSEAASGGGEGGALARWRWFRDLHPRPDNPDLCTRLLGAMDAENWDQLQYALPKHAEIYKGRSTRRIALASKYLKEGIFWELKRDRSVNPAATPKQQKAEKKANEAEMRMKQVQYLKHMIEDPELDEETKAGAMADLAKLEAQGKAAK